MKTTWDLDYDVSRDIAGVDLQQTRVRPRTRAGGSSVLFGIAAGALTASAHSVVLLPPFYASTPIVSVSSVVRSEQLSRRPERRGDREQFAAEARQGTSTLRLAQLFPAVLAPAPEGESDVDYSFG